MKKLKTYTYKVIPYPFNLHFCLVEGEHEGFSENESGKTIKCDFDIFIYLRKGEITIPTVAHEIFHATEFIMNAIGQRIDTQNPNEAWAYLLEELMKQFYKCKFKE